MLVTGAGRGIGAGICRAVGEAGGAVAVSDVDGRSARETAAALRATGVRASGFRLDVTDEAEVEAGVARATAELGGLDGLVCNAGVIEPTAALETSYAAWRRQLEVNLDGVFLCCRAAARAMAARAERGAIVNVASNAGKVGYPNMAAYNASKAAVIRLTRTLAEEWAERGINVNAVCPGGVDTPMLREVARLLAERGAGDRETLLEAMRPRLMDRHIEPVEVGRVVAFLLSDHAAVIRGQAINVDGGDAPY